MQVFKCINKKAQNLIEFAFVLPIIIFITLCIFEVALFWQEVNAIYSLNTEINASAGLQDAVELNLGDECPAAQRALTVLESKDNAIGLSDVNYSKIIQDGSEPFALYRYVSINKIVSTGDPQVTLWVDCRNPFENGIITQIEFYHKTLVMKASIPRFDKPEPIVIIPDKIFIASPKLNTIKHY